MLSSCLTSTRCSPPGEPDPSPPPLLQSKGTSHSPIICFCLCSGAAASMDTVRGSCPGMRTAGSWTCTRCRGHIPSLPRMGKASKYLTLSGEHRAPGRLWKRGAGARHGQLGGTESPARAWWTERQSYTLTQMFSTVLGTSKRP